MREGVRMSSDRSAEGGSRMAGRKADLGTAGKTEGAYVPRTELGRRLLEHRKRILASGQTRTRQEILDELRKRRSTG